VGISLLQKKRKYLCSYHISPRAQASAARSKESREKEEVEARRALVLLPKKEAKGQKDQLLQKYPSSFKEVDRATLAKQALKLRRERGERQLEVSDAKEKTPRRTKKALRTRAERRKSCEDGGKKKDPSRQGKKKTRVYATKSLKERRLEKQEPAAHRGRKRESCLKKIHHLFKEKTTNEDEN